MARKTGSPRAGRKRRGSGEDMTEAKANTVEMRTIGDNSQLPLPKPDDYDYHMRTIKGLTEKSATAASQLRHAKNSANKACPGLAASIQETLAIEREGDPVKLKRRFDLLGLGLNRIGSTVQLSVFDTLEGDEKELVEKRGYEDGKAGRTPDNKYPEGSDLAAIYNTAWQKGQAELLGVEVEEPAEQTENANA